MAQPFLIGPPAFAPNARQALLKFKPGEEQPKLARELAGSVYARVRTAEPLVAVTLDPRKAVSAAGRSGVELTGALRTDAKGWRFVDVAVSIPDATDAGAGSASHGFSGVRVTAADGTALALGLETGEASVGAGRYAVKLTLGAVAKTGLAPATVTFWGTPLRQVEIPFALHDVPLGSEPK